MPLPKRFQTPLALLSIFMLTFAIYLPVLNNTFIFDDTHWIIAAEKFKWTLHDFFSVPIIYFRPATLVLFWIMQKFFGTHPTGYYAFTVLLHTVNTLLVFFVMRALAVLLRFEKPDVSSFLSAMTFSILSTHSAAVLVISACTHTMLTTFYLLCLLSFLYFCETQKRRYFIFCMISFILGLMTDLPMITMPLLLTACGVMYPRGIGKQENTVLFRSCATAVCSMAVLTFAYILCYVLLIKGKGYNVLPSNFFQFWLVYASFLQKIFFETLGLIKEAELYPLLTRALFAMNTALLLFLFTEGIFRGSRSRKSSFYLSSGLFIASILISAFPYVLIKARDMLSYDSSPRYRYSYLPSVFSSMLVGNLAHLVYTKSRGLRMDIRRSALIILFSCMFLANYRGIKTAEKTYDFYGKLGKWFLSGVAHLCENHFQSGRVVYLVNIPETPQMAMSHPHLENLMRFYIRRNLSIVWLSDEEYLKTKDKKTKHGDCFIRFDPVPNKLARLTP